MINRDLIVELLKHPLDAHVTLSVGYSHTPCSRVTYGCYIADTPDTGTFFEGESHDPGEDDCMKAVDLR